MTSFERDRHPDKWTVTATWEESHHGAVYVFGEQAWATTRRQAEELRATFRDDYGQRAGFKTDVVGPDTKFDPAVSRARATALAATLKGALQSAPAT